MQFLAGCGLVSVMWLGLAALPSHDSLHQTSGRSGNGTWLSNRDRSLVRFIAFGDVNLGRAVGQRILQGDTLYPFACVCDSISAYDLVFANLECQISDQNGETQDPRNNLVFTGPPGGAHSLKKGGIGVVSTANNHALDYGIGALKETISHLDHAGVKHIGTSAIASGVYSPLTFSLNGIHIAFLACTEVMNIEDPVWKRYVAEADTGKLLPAVRAIRDSVDFVIVSYHGGEEYADKPSVRTKEFARQVIFGGADLFLGHHPHVPYGVEQIGGKYIVHSLGNFAFCQPDRFWTQYSFAFDATITKDLFGTRVVTSRLIPMHAGFQPKYVVDKNVTEIILERIRALSTQSFASQGNQ